MNTYLLAQKEKLLMEIHILSREYKGNKIFPLTLQARKRRLQQLENEINRYNGN